MEYVFATGMSRSGTMLLAGLLSGVEGASAHHERCTARDVPFAAMSWYLGDSFAVPYLQRAREDIEREHDAPFFVDVSSSLQRAVGALRKVFDPREVFHLVRDPREVVRSRYARHTDKSLLLAPKENIDAWIDSDKFTRLCREWADTTAILVAEGTRLVRFEELIGSYEYFRGQVLAPLGWELSEEKWRSHTSERVNHTRSSLRRYVWAALKGREHIQALPAYGQWSAQQKETLREVCGEQMELVGYEPDA